MLFLTAKDIISSFYKFISFQIAHAKSGYKATGVFQGDFEF
jgi:hypothetical protein